MLLQLMANNEGPPDGDGDATGCDIPNLGVINALPERCGLEYSLVRGSSCRTHDSCITQYVIEILVSYRVAG